ncbi:MAG: hypothetical protein RJA22_1673 [Verrucomicrobiota bacterium]|jgi:hypothetical protein
MAAFRHLLAALALACLLAATPPPAAGAASTPEERVDFLHTPKAHYTNVVILSKSQSSLFIRHAGGLASIKVRDLDKSTQLQLGYQLISDPAEEVDPAPAPAQPDPEADALAEFEVTAPDLEFNLDPRYEEWYEKAVWESREFVAGMPPILRYAWLTLGGVLFLVFSFCSHLICRKAGQPANPLVWLPVLQVIPLARAAGMSWLWCVGILVPGLNLLGYAIWCFQIATARGKAPWVGFLLLLPGLNILAFLYLALSDSRKDPQAAKGTRKVVVLNQPSSRRRAA